MAPKVGMNNRLIKSIMFLVALFLLLSYQVESQVKNNKPLVWDMDYLEKIKKNNSLKVEFNRIIKEADSECNKMAITVTKKKKTFAPDNHYYCSVGTYWWPDPDHPGQYINKDGIVNPETKDFDQTRLLELKDRCKVLSQAFYLTHDKRYYRKFVEQLRLWFVDSNTYMYPNFEYSQVIPGQNGNRGRNTGMIESYYFNTIIESVRLVNGIKRIDSRTLKAVQNWFGDFACWADEGEFGESLHNANNNIGLAYDITLINMYLFAGHEKRAKEIANEFTDRRLNKQITIDGKQPSELRRTRAFSYSVYNLNRILDYCFLVAYWYPNYYQEHKERIDAAFAFLGAFIDNTQSFPYQQITSWEICKEEYQQAYGRLKQLNK